MSLDVEFVRRQYPVLNDPTTAEWAFFENAGGSYVPKQVSDALHEYFTQYKVQPYGLSEPSIKAGEAMDAGYDYITQLLNADADEITIGPSTTLNFYMLAQAIRPLLKAGDEIIVTNQDHEANIGCWRRLEEFGVVIKEWRIDPNTGELYTADLENLLSDKTRLVCFTLCSNVVGSVNNIAEITRLAKSVNAWTIADGVSYAPHHSVDVKAWDVDLYCFSTYKTFATHLGVLWGRREVLDQLQPQCHYFNIDKPHYKFNPTGPLHAEIGALAGLGKYYDLIYEHHFKAAGLGFHQKAEKVFELFLQQEMKLATQLLDTLRELPVRIIGQSSMQAGKRASTISFVPENKTSTEVVLAAAEKQIAIRNGHFYALRCMEGLEITDTEAGVVRVSAVHYNNQDEMSRLCEMLKQIL